MTRILGQDRAIEILDHALRSGRFHHGWIFSGPRGVGKFTAALHTARILLDPELEANSAADLKSEIANPQSQISPTHPDLHIIRKDLAKYSDNRDLREKKQSNIPIDLLRERIIGGQSGPTYHEAPAYRTSAYGHGKAFIIDEAELLDVTGQNAMLKTLEEPPSETYFFLITSQPDDLLPTIRSRCQHVRFQSLDEPTMRTVLREAARQTPELFKSITPADARWILDFADGSPGIAMLALEYNFLNWRKTLEPLLQELDRSRFPAAMGDTLAGLVDEFAKQWVKAHGEKTTSKDAANKSGARHVLFLLAAHARAQLAEAIAHHADPSRAIAIVELIHDAERQLDSNVNMKMLMENLVVQWNETGNAARTVTQ